MKKESPKEENKLDSQTVFIISESGIRTSRKSQCKPGDHQWVKINDNEYECPLCGTIIITQYEQPN
jgi:hypothetical protein